MDQRPNNMNTANRQIENDQQDLVKRMGIRRFIEHWKSKTKLPKEKRLISMHAEQLFSASSSIDLDSLSSKLTESLVLSNQNRANSTDKDSTSQHSKLPLTVKHAALVVGFQNSAFQPKKLVKTDRLDFVSMINSTNGNEKVDESILKVEEMEIIKSCENDWFEEIDQSQSQETLSETIKIFITDPNGNTRLLSSDEEMDNQENLQRNDESTDEQIDLNHLFADRNEIIENRSLRDFYTTKAAPIEHDRHVLTEICEESETEDDDCVDELPKVLSLPETNLKKCPNDRKREDFSSFSIRASLKLDLDDRFSRQNSCFNSIDQTQRKTFNRLNINKYLV